MRDVGGDLRRKVWTKRRRFDKGYASGTVKGGVRGSGGQREGGGGVTEELGGATVHRAVVWASAAKRAHILGYLAGHGCWGSVTWSGRHRSHASLERRLNARRCAHVSDIVVHILHEARRDWACWCGLKQADIVPKRRRPQFYPFFRKAFARAGPLYTANRSSTARCANRFQSPLFGVTRSL